MTTTKERQSQLVRRMLRNDTPYFETLYADDVADLVTGLLLRGARVHACRTPTGGFRVTCPGDGGIPYPPEKKDLRYMTNELLQGESIYLEGMYQFIDLTGYLERNMTEEDFNNLMDQLAMSMIGVEEGSPRLKVRTSTR